MWQRDRSDLRHLPTLYNKRNYCIHLQVYLFVQVYVHLFHWLNCYAHLKRSFQHHVNSKVTWILLLIQVITALGKIWHIEHFSCAKCHETLGTKNFYERDGMAYCERDYHTLFAPKCSYCNGPIVDVSVF